MGSINPPPSLGVDPLDLKTMAVATEAVVENSPDASVHDDDDAADEAWVYPHPTGFKLGEHPIDEYKSLNVVIIGAGLSGITAGILLPIKVPGIKLTILDKNSDVGGTWYENRYPGVRCDIPAHVYQSTFAPRTQWTEEYAQGPEIRDYWQSVARKYNLYDKIRLRTRVLGAYWEPDQAQWRIETERDGLRTTEHFDFVVTCFGRFNSWKMPKYPGMDKFKGLLRHSSDWDESFDPTGKTIATIGNGASGIQVTAELWKTAKHVDHYARHPTWIAGSFNPFVEDRPDIPVPFSSEQLESWKDPRKYLEFRKDLEDKYFRGFEGQLLTSEASKNARARFTELMRRRLGEHAPEMLDKLVPDFPPHCRRLTPGPGYLEALTKDNVTLIQTQIDHFTEDGIVTIDGVHRPVDTVICSTGANIDYAPAFPIVSGEYDLSKDWKHDGKFTWPYTYIGIGTPGFPNLSFVLGPNPAGPADTMPHAAETQITYIARMLRKMSTQRIRTMAPSKSAADDFVEYCDAFFPRMNLSRNCSSWSNGGRPGARIHGHWPGSGAHLRHVRRDPRWEDFEYTYDRSENRFAYWGNGRVSIEDDLSKDLVSYLKLEENNDLRDLHERWWDI